MERLWDSLMIHLGGEGQYETARVGAFIWSFIPSLFLVISLTRPLTDMETTLAI